jgi:rSAM/selenodomain-associated transferase 2
MISVVIPTLNAAQMLPVCLAALVPAAIDGIISDVVIADGGSTDATLDIADASGCRVLSCKERGRGQQLLAGALEARQPWLLFLHADTVLAPGWHDEVAALIKAVDSGSRAPVAAAFRFALDDTAWAARIVERGVALRCRVFKLPFGDQGLLLPRSLYEQVGGYPALPLMEDVALVQAVPRRQRHMLAACATTSAARYRTNGYTRRILTNWSCLTLYAAGVPISRIVQLYRGRNDG